MRCSAEKCGTGVPPGRPFCTRHMQLIPYRITREFWVQGPAREDAVRDAVVYLRELGSE